MDNLKEKTAKGIAWGAVNNGTTQVLNLLIGIYLARKLSETDYGIVALITIFTTLAGCIQSAGFSQALANLKPPTFRDYNAVCWFNIIAGFSMYAILFLCAPFIAYFFDQPILTDVSRLAFLAIPLSALGIVPNAKLWIELRNRELAIASIAALVLSGSTGIWLAYHQYSYWSLVWQQLIFIGMSTLIKFFFTRWTPKLPVDFGPVRQMFGFSSKLLLTNILTVTSQNVQTFIFGKMLPINTVGQFSQANKWNFMGYSFISNTMAQVAQPVLTNADDEEDRQQRVFRKMLRFTSLVCFPLMFGLALVAHEFIIVTIGAKWEPSVVLLQLLCIGGAFVPLHTLYQNLIISRGRSDIYLWLVALQIVLQIGITLSLSSLGIVAMVAAFSGLNVLYTVCWHVALQRICPLAITDALKDTIPFVAIAAIVMLATHYATLPIASLWLLLPARIVMAAALYYAVMRLLNVAILKECLQFVKSKKVKA
jgi:O-antigen/teichoic acid export membrane protein